MRRVHPPGLVLSREGGFTRLVAAFYRQVPGDDIIGPMYPADDLPGAEERLRDFLVGRFGGPPRYIEQRGHPRLRMRHAPFAVTPTAKDHWLTHFRAALDDARGAGLLTEEQDATLASIVVREEIRLDVAEDQYLTLRPYDGLRVTYELSYPPPVGDQTYVFTMRDARDFRREIAPARTFGFVEEIRALESAGLGQGGQLGNFILIGEQGIVNTELRFPEELARHKILDILGDFYLLGAPLRGEIHARKTGHQANVAMVRKIREMLASGASVPNRK